MCQNTLSVKGGEYATEDRLHNFKVAARMQGVTPKQALGGMMAKHTVSVYDLIWDEEDNDEMLWAEKITDHINYLLLLKAILDEEREDAESAESDDHAET